MKYINAPHVKNQNKDWQKLAGKTIKSILLQEVDHYSDGSNVVQVVTIEFTDGSTYAIVGESGCGDQYAQCRLTVGKFVGDDEDEDDN